MRVAWFGAVLAVLGAAAATESPYQVEFEVSLSKGVTDTFTVEVYPEWVPRSGPVQGDHRDRDLQLGRSLFPVTVSGFTMPSGTTAKPSVAAKWRRTRSKTTR